MPTDRDISILFLGDVLIRNAGKGGKERHLISNKEHKTIRETDSLIGEDGSHSTAGQKIP